MAEKNGTGSARHLTVRHRGRLAQIGIYFGKFIRMFVYQSDWKVLPMAALIAGLVGFALGSGFGKTMEGTLTGAFAIVCVCIWNGSFNSIQVVCRERNVIKREHRSGMHISSYILAHMMYQLLLCVLQTIVTLIVLYLVGMRFSGKGMFTPWMQVNETRLKQLDEVLALCMKNDIHLMLVCTQIQDVSQWANFNDEFERSGPGPVTDQEISDFAAFWQMLARRYANIPNEYLSFNLYNEIHIETEEEYERVLGPAVDAIRAESPDRTIIADIHMGGLTGESMAKHGVALSYHLYDPMGFVYINQLGPEKMTDANFMHSVTWPYTENGKTYDAAALLDTPLHYMPNAASINSMRALAAQYDVGFMVGEFGVFGEYKNGMATVRYTDEALFGYYRDVIETFEKEGIGWIRGQLSGTWGIQACYPAVEGVQYEKVGLYYVDTGFRDLLKSFEK